jgi:hypothetical protein
MQKTTAIKDKTLPPTYSDQYKTGSSQDKGKACADGPPSKPTDEKKKKNCGPTRGKPHAHHTLFESTLDYPHFKIAHPILTLTQRISDPVPPPLQHHILPTLSHLLDHLVDLPSTWSKKEAKKGTRNVTLPHLSQGQKYPC